MSNQINKISEKFEIVNNIILKKYEIEKRKNKYSNNKIILEN